LKEGTRSTDIPSQIRLVGEVDRSKIVEQLIPLIEQLVTDNSLKREDSDYGYVRVRSKLLLSLGSLKSNIFIRLFDRKFLKIFHGGDSFEQSDFDKYTGQRNIEYFYLQQEDCESFIDVYNADLRRLLSINPPPNPEGVFLMAEQAQETVQSLVKQFGFTPQVQEVTKNQIALSIKTMGKSPKLRDILARMKAGEGKYISSHSTMTAYVACSLAAAMKWDSDGTFFKLNMASFLHDMTLENDDLSRIESLKELESRKSDFTPDEIRAYKIHTLCGGELAQKFHEIPPDVDSIIFQHHERPNGEGFPRQMKQNQIAPLAALFIVAHDFVKYSFANPTNLSVTDYVKSKEDFYILGNFKKIVRLISEVS